MDTMVMLPSDVFPGSDGIDVARDERWITTGEFAALAGVAESTVWRWSARGRLAGIRQYKPGARTYYLRDDVVAFIRDRGGIVQEGAPGAQEGMRDTE